MSARSSAIVLEHEDVTEIRNMLLTGLASYGEIERLVGELGILNLLEAAPVLDRIRVIHPTGSHETTCQFANALRTLEYANSLESECRILRKLEASRAPRSMPPAERFTV